MSAALVLAAGHGARMGGPKALLVLEGKTLVERHVARFVELSCAPIVVVTRPELAACVRALVDVIVVEIASESQDASLAVGLSHVRGATFVTPVDLVPPRPETYRALERALGDHDAATPTHDGHGGHPVLVRVGALPEGSTLRDRLNALGDRRVRVPVSDPSILVDLDEPADLSA
jgi:molybdenum cofactor cytidylyltransferase